jgi:hypothetical protein
MDLISQNGKEQAWIYGILFAASQEPSAPRFDYNLSM